MFYQIKFKDFCVGLMVLVLLQSCQEPKSFTSILSSPNGEIVLNLIKENKQLKYQIKKKGQLVLGTSLIGILPNQQFEVKKVTTKTVKDHWKPVWGQFSTIEDHCFESQIDMDFSGIAVQFICRVYNNGVAFRYQIPAQEKVDEVQLESTFNLLAKSKIYYPKGEKEPVGPVLLKDAEQQKEIKLPIVVDLPQGGHLAILESDLYSANGFEVMKFKNDGKKLSVINKVETKNKKLVTPWRLILIEDQIGDLVTNTVALNLATSNQLEDSSWIKPGKTLWDWRVHGYVAPDGFTYGINTESYLRFIDFAAKNNIEYFLIDDAWYTKITKGHITHSKKLDLAKVSAYAKEKGVDLILYYDRRHGSYGDDALFDHYQELGMKGIKYGFMQDNVDFTRNAIASSAKSKLLIDFHDGPVPFTGISRTFPNAVTREYCHAQQDSRRAFTPESFIKMALINAIQGPLDMNNGNFDLSGIDAGKRQKGPRKIGSYLSTVTAEAARTLIIHSGLVCIPDAPEAYEAKLDLFEFIQKQPVGKWDESKVLFAKIGAYISTARRQGSQWFVGSVASQQGASLDIKLDFLEEDKVYEVTYYEDTDKTHCDTNPEAYQIRKSTVKKDDIVKAVMAPGGGHCMWIRLKK